MADTTVPDLEAKNFGDIRNNIIEADGVRQIGPPPGYVGNKPSKDCEIFIGKLPQDIFEDILINLFEQFGKIYELRLMMKNIGESKGYAFIRYMNAVDAKNAIEHLDGFNITSGVQIAVCKSTDNRRVFIRGMPEGKSEEEIIAEMRKYTQGVCAITLVDFFPDHVFIAYNSPQEAVAAKNCLKGKKLFGVKVKVKLANPEIEFNDDNTVQEVVAEAGTGDPDQMPAVVVDTHGNPIVCSVCGYEKRQNDNRKFVRARCGHDYCRICSNHKFHRSNPVKPHFCDVCGERIKGNYNKPLTGDLLINE